MPTKRSTPTNPASAVRRARIGVGIPAPTMAVAPFISNRSSPFPIRMTTPGKPPSFTSTLEPSPRTTHGSPRSCASSSADHILAVGGQGEVAGRPADPPRGVAGQRLVLEQLAAEFDSGRGRRQRLRRFGFGLGGRFCYAFAAATCPPPTVGDLSPFALSCH